MKAPKADSVSSNIEREYIRDPISFRCRVEEFIAIVPKQPYRPPAVSNEVRMEFEAVLLDAQRERQNQLWIHAKIKACVREEDCVAVRRNENMGLSINDVYT